MVEQNDSDEENQERLTISLSSEVGQNLQKINEQLSQSVQQWAKLATQMERWAQELKTRLQESLPTKAELKQAVEAQATRAEQLASEGWTLPMGMTARQVAWILEESEEETDKVMLAAFEEWNLFDGIEERLAESQLLDPWRPLIDECLVSYRDGRHIVAIPGLIAVIEGAVITSLRDRSSKAQIKQEVNRYYKQFDNQPWRFKRVLAASVKEFLNTLFASHSYAEKRRTIINRHWIHHGRDFPEEWKKEDAIRLFNALDTIVALLPEPADQEPE